MVHQVFNEIAGDDGSMDIQEFVQWLNAEWRAQRLRQRGEVVEGYDDGENDVDEIPDAEKLGDGEGSEGGDDIDPYLSTAGSVPSSPLKARGDAPDVPLTSPRPMQQRQAQRRKLPLLLPLVRQTGVPRSRRLSKAVEIWRRSPPRRCRPRYQVRAPNYTRTCTSHATTASSVVSGGWPTTQTLIWKVTRHRVVFQRAAPPYSAVDR